RVRRPLPARPSTRRRAPTARPPTRPTQRGGLGPRMHCAVDTQLAPGHRWLEEQHRAKAERARPPAAVLDPKWAGLCHDSRSCIDTVGPLSAAPAQVLVLQTQPATITDGRRHCQASLAGACHRALRAHPPGRQNARHTVHLLRPSKSQPSSALAPPRLALHRCTDTSSTLLQLDHARLRRDDRCLQSQPGQEEHLARRTPAMAGATESDADSAVDTQMPFGTQLPHPVRSRTDSGEVEYVGINRMALPHPLRSRTDTGEVEYVGINRMELPHPLRSQRDSGDVEFVGINRMEPVLAGNTQRAALKPRSAHSDVARQQAQLLALIHKGNPPVPPQSQSRSVPVEPRALAEPTAMHPPQSEQAPSRATDHETLQDAHAGAAQPPTDKDKKRMREADHDSPPIHQPAKKPSLSEHGPKHSRAREMDKFAAECSWMKGLKLDRASATVPVDQALLLQKPESWYKPEPGHRAVNEVPAQVLMVLSRMADEAAALEGATSSGSYHDTNPSSASYPAHSAPQPTDEETTDSEDEPPTSPYSWHTSPSPEPPQRPTFPRQGLPPDSSLELPQHGAETVALQSLKTQHRPQNHPLPASSHEHETDFQTQNRPQNHPLPASSRQHETDFPPSSPPACQAAADSDEDMELEISVPRALGEDSLSQPMLPSQLSRAEPRQKSVVQVAETPYVKGRNVQHPVVTVLPPTQSSNPQSENSSSASVVRGTYQDPSSSAVEETKLDALQNDNGQALQRTAITINQDHEIQNPALIDTLARQKPAGHTSRQDDSERNTTNLGIEAVQDTNPLQPEPTPMSAQLPLKDSSSGEQSAPTSDKTARTMPPQIGIEATRLPPASPSLTKRKRSPTTPQGFKQSRKRSKLKVVLFTKKDGGERQQSTTSAESRQGSVSDQSVQQVADTKLDGLDIKKSAQAQATENTVVVEPDMSPRHQSLYAPPSPVSRPTAKPAIPSLPESVVNAQTEQAVPESVVIAQTEQPVPESVVAQTEQALPESVVIAQTEQALPESVVIAQTEQPVPETTLAGRSATEKAVTTQRSRTQSPPKTSSVPSWELQAEPASAPLPAPDHATVPEPRPSIRTEHAPPVAPVDVPVTKTVSEMFRAAYPDYRGTAKHFANQCKQIERLDREDKMVSKSMWDDFIIRNQTDYKPYVSNCIDAGEEPIPYIRFYKDNIDLPIHTKKIVAARATLLKALQELGVQPSAAEASPLQPSNWQHVQQPSHQSPAPRMRQGKHSRLSYQQSNRQSVQQSSRPPPQQPDRQSVQQSSQPPPQQPTHSPWPPSTQSIITPPKKKKPRASLPFSRPSTSTPARTNGTASVRRSLDASSYHAAPTSISSSSTAAQPTTSARSRLASAFGDRLRDYKNDGPPSSIDSSTGHQFRDFLRGQQRLTSVTGSRRVDRDKKKLWPESVELRLSVMDMQPRRKIDILEWKDEL
ncbi:hypothetical protein SVAN01_04624, partial [Stagonosporopsis vannaccii]